ncbi:hypothetical protein Hanom_Chr16g01481161 [Helianthus anomalus]
MIFEVFGLILPLKSRLSIYILIVIKFVAVVLIYFKYMQTIVLVDVLKKKNISDTLKTPRDNTNKEPNTHLIFENIHLYGVCDLDS